MSNTPIPDPNVERVRWPGSGSNPRGLTPFGTFDNDPVFLDEAPRAADWAARRLGYPIIDVELLDIQFYACYEEAMYEYSALVNQFNIRQNMSRLQGQSTTTNFTQKNIQGSSLPFIVKLSQGYGTEAGVGGYVDWKRGSIKVKRGVQTYDLQSLYGNVFENGDRIEIKKVFHDIVPAIARVYDPFSMTGMSYSNILNEMGFAGYSPATQFLMTPIFEDILRNQAIELNDIVRKSQYSFELVNNKIRVFPLPTYDFNMYFDYVLTKDRDAQGLGITNDGTGSSGSNGDVIGDYSNISYDFIQFSKINSVGKQWINKFFLALCKELLGAIRAKYQSIPVPGSEITLDGAELRSEAAAEKEALKTELKESLEESSRRKQLENSIAEVEAISTQLKQVPLLIYVG
jgi:hypothetical protein